MNGQRSKLWLPVFIFIFYLFQGILYGLQVKFLPMNLRRKGSSLSFIGSLNLLALPWLIKSLWAPLVDLYATIKAWLTVTLTGILICLCLLHFTQEGRTLTLVIIVLNFFSATHEMVIGKIMLSGYDDHQLKTASSYKIFAYKTGCLLGGGVTVWISSVLAITDQVFLINSAIYSALLLFTIVLLPEFFPEKPEVGPRDIQMISPIKEVKSVRSNMAGLRLLCINLLRGSKWMVTCLLVYKFASHSSHLLFTMALVDQGVRLSDIGLLSGVIGHVLSLLVAMVTGIILSHKRLSSISILGCISLLDVLSVFIQICIVLCSSHTSKITVFVSFCLQHIVLGAQAIPVFSIVLVFSQRAHPKYQATQHSIYNTLDTLGSKLSLFVSGLMADIFGYTFGLCASFVVSMLMLVLVINGPNDYEIDSNINFEKRKAK